ncbi:MAG: DNA mismatch repair protein MutS [Oscillatoriales cyanobacterium]|nr:MAG: DNA mismatch repair protein MutS [Oscillatoriales cyanobacterium]
MSASLPRDIPNADYRLLDSEKLTPMMQHYVAVKEQHPQALLLYRVGDFFETFFQDACTIAEVLELVLTSKEGGKEVGRVPMAGVPHHAIERYAAQLVQKGYAVALCDQTQDAAEAQGLVRREVTRILTPGTVIEEGMLAARKNNFLGAIVLERRHWGLAYADISTGEFWATQGEESEALVQELWRLSPSEVLVPVNAPDLVGLLRPGESRSSLNGRGFPDWLPAQFCYALRPQSRFGATETRQRLLERFRLRSLEGIGCDRRPLAMRAAGGLLAYLEETHPSSEAQTREIPLQLLKTYEITDYLILDHQTRRNLEIVQTVRDGTLTGSLLWALDRTVTAMGGRALRRWLLQPLLDLDGITARQGAIGELIDRPDLRQDLQRLLREMYDLERLAGRAGAGSANARDLAALADSLGRLPELARVVADGQSPYFRVLQQVPPELEQLGDRLRGALVEEPPLSVTEGGLIRDGVNGQLNTMRQQSAGDREWLANLEAIERQRTGINTLKVGYNKTFGYFIGVSRAKADLVPDDYIRKQTLVNEERYITPELKEREARILSARDDLNRLEYEIFCELRSATGLLADQIRRVALAVAAIDVLVNLAELAIARGYCRPTVDRGRMIAIDQGRHPVVEQSLPEGFFVPNSTQLGYEIVNGELVDPQAEFTDPQPDLVVLTGPNASGKSCYLRQVGLIQLMAQVGSYVPAKSARLGICDRIFTRVGAVDDLATGQSTFMVEMNETANILNHATDRSLVLLDEIGRGTATFDGLAIAWSVAEYLASELRSRSIFATHYHELNELATLLENVANYQVAVKELPDRIVFLHQVQPGGADRSYGIEAARLAGLPPSTIARAREIMAQIEKHSKIAVGLRHSNSSGTKPTTAAGVVTPDPSLSSSAAQLDIFSKKN